MMRNQDKFVLAALPILIRLFKGCSIRRIASLRDKTDNVTGAIGLRIMSNINATYRVDGGCNKPVPKLLNKLDRISDRLAVVGTIHHRAIDVIFTTIDSPDDHPALGVSEAG